VTHTATRHGTNVSALLAVVSLPYLRRHLGLVLVLVLAVSLGVSSMVATGTLIESLIRSFEESWGADQGAADLRIANGFAGVPQDLIEAVRQVDGVAAAAGVVTVSGRVLGDEPTELVLIGIDLFGGDDIHASLTEGASEEARLLDLSVFLVRLDAVALARDFADAHGLEIGTDFEVDLPTGRRVLHVAALFTRRGPLARIGGAVAIADLPAAQRLAGREEMLQAVDVRAAPGVDVQTVHERLGALVSGVATIAPAGTGSPEFRSLIFNIRLVLDVAGAVALVIGAIVIYHAVGMAISARKPEIDIVRTLGASRRSVLAMLSIEAWLLGALGSLTGAVAGTGLAWMAGEIFEQSAGTLYMQASVSSFAWSPRYVAFASAIAITLTWIATIRPGLQATRVTSGLRVSSVSAERWSHAVRYAVAGAFAFLAGVLIPVAADPRLGTAALAAIVITGDVLVIAGLGLSLPVVVLIASPLLRRAVAHTTSPELRLASASLVADPARSAAVLTSIMFATANVLNTVAVVESIRDGVMDWLGNAQDADLLVTAAGAIGLLPSSPAIPRAVEDAVRESPFVARAEAFRLVAQPFEDRWVVVSTRDPGLARPERHVTVVAGDPKQASRRLLAGSAFVASQHFARKHGLTVGDRVELRTPSGPVALELAAVVVDYSGDLGTLFVAPSTYRHWWRDDGLTGVRIQLARGADAGDARRALEAAIEPLCDCGMLSQDEFREQAQSIVDGTFYTAYALEAVASFVMAVAVYCFFTISLDERRSELELIRHVGATRRQLVGSVLVEVAALGLLGGAIGSIVAFWLAQRIIDGAIQVGGGLVLGFSAPLGAALFATAAAVGVSLLAGLSPALRSARRSIAIESE
jgi:putative ABC transport system permease protein